MNTLAPRTVTITTTAQQILSADGYRKAVLVRNLGAASVFLSGTSNVAISGANKGWEVLTGQDFPDTISNGNIWAVAAGNNDIMIWEISL